jgi:hypothetical protein
MIQDSDFDNSGFFVAPSHVRPFNKQTSVYTETPHRGNVCVLNFNFERG